MFMILASFGRIEGQACLPDSMYIDSSGFVFPLPYDSLNNPMGGIDKEACINQEFEFTWTLKVPDTVLFPGIPIPIPVDYFRIDTIGAISNLPSGLTYKCNPPNCLFDAGSLGCVIIQGTPLPINPVGTYDLEFVGNLKTATGATIPVTFPNPQLFPGHYYLKLNEENSPNCTTSVDEPGERILQTRVFPNPVDALSLLEIELQRGSELQIVIMDLTGRVFRSWRLSVPGGRHQIPLDLSAMPAGYWVYQVVADDGKRAVGNLISTLR